ncbi:hypothetical protein QTP86_032030, partial [Hemibagrus guttatus]
KMAEASISVGHDQFSCPVCLDLLKDPVTIPCGHSFCKVCINGHWDKEDQMGVYSCPQCRDTFTPRPVLRRNNMLAEVVEKLKKKTEVQAASPAHCYTGPGDVECDFCTGRKHKAVKSCLMCVASFCETHLKPHLEVPALKKHTLIEALIKLQEKICSKHEKLIEIYCRTDKTCICYLCTMDNHKGHDTVTAAEERAEKESEVKEEQMKFQQRIQEKQKKVQELKQTVNTIKLSAQTAVEDSEMIFTELISSMEKKRSEVMELIRAQEKTELSRAERLLEQLEQEIADLQRRLTELEQFLHTQDHIQFLQVLTSERWAPELHKPKCNTSSMTVPQHLSFEGMMDSLSDLKKRLKDFCKEEFKNKITTHDFCYLTLDPNTVQCYLFLSEKNRVVTGSKIERQYSNHLDRFDTWEQVLSKESVSGRCYWDVEWSGVVEISVSYKDIGRKGQGFECAFGRNNQSWSLWCSSTALSFWHNNIKTDLRVPSSPRIRVYVDQNRKDYSGVITLHKPVPPHLLYHTPPKRVGQKSSSVVECPYIHRSVNQKSTRVITRPGSEADKAFTHSPCSVKHLQDQFLSKRQEADAITQPLLDTENGFIKDLEHFLNHRDMLNVRKRELLHKRWTECVWWPVQRSIEQRFTHRRCEGSEPTKMMRTGYVNYSTKVSTALLKDPLFLHSHSRLKENRAVLHCQTGCVDGCQWMASSEELGRNKRDLHRGSRIQGPVYMATADGRCFRPECWSAIGLSRSYSERS